MGLLTIHGLASIALWKVKGIKILPGNIFLITKKLIITLKIHEICSENWRMMTSL